VSHTGVFQVQAGPSKSSAAVVVSSFISEAGLTAVCACHDRRGCEAPSSCTTATKASWGTWARANAASTVAGRGVGVAAACAKHRGDASTAQVSPRDFNSKVFMHKIIAWATTNLGDKLAASFLITHPADMSRLLAFDTSTQTMSVTLWVNGEVLVFDGEGGAAASTQLMAQIHRLLAQAQTSLQALDAIGFGRGPGAFTGLRTACAVAQGLALGSDKPVLALDSLLAVAQDACLTQDALHQQQGQPIWVVNDARMGEVYAAQYVWRLATADWQRLTAPFLCRPEVLCDAWVSNPPLAMAGNALLVPELAQALVQAPCLHNVAQFPRAQVRANALAILADQAWRRADAVDAALALPLYVRDQVALTTAQRQAARVEVNKV
jgi:tRNA threonylcarbamoyladenosine biosynthesis protein TsaB